MAPAELARSIVFLKRATPHADVTRMAVVAPQLLTLSEAQAAQFFAAAQRMREALPGVDVDRMLQAPPAAAACRCGCGDANKRAQITPLCGTCPRFQEDPAVAFMGDGPLCFGLAELTELWDEGAMATIEPDHCALALRGLLNRPRRGFTYRLFDPLKPGDELSRL